MAVIEGEPMTQQIVQGAAATLSITVYADGVLADPGVTTVTIARLDGSAVATDAATTGTGAAAREYALTAAETAALDVLAVTWQTANHGVLRQVVEIVGGVLFTIRQARAHDSAALASNTAYTTADIEQARDRITDDFARICGVSFVPRLRRVVVDGATELLLPDPRVSAVRSIEALDDDGVTWAVEPEAARVVGGGRVTRPGRAFSRGAGRYRVIYEHGWDVVPEPIRLAALTVLRYTLVPDNVGQRTTSLTNEFGSTAFATAGRLFNSLSAYPHYGIPLVDTTLGRYTERVPAVA